MPEVNATKASAATLSEAPKSSVRRNAAQSLLTISGMMAAPPRSRKIATTPDAFVPPTWSWASCAGVSWSVRRPGTSHTSTTRSTSDAPMRCACRPTPSQAISEAMLPPTTVPRLHIPCRRFITGVSRRSEIAEPCTFIPTSVKTSTAPNAPSTSTSCHGAVTKPMSGNTITNPRAPLLIVIFVPKRSRTGETATLPRSPPKVASEIKSPMVRRSTSSLSRMPGSLGTNDARTAPFMKNWPATEASARLSPGNTRWFFEAVVTSEL